MTKATHSSSWQNDFLRQHNLDTSFLKTAQVWFTHLVNQLADYQHVLGRPVLVALNGCQGSGKTTVSDYLCRSLIEEHGRHAVAMSLDDFYLGRAERQALAATIHPLLATRGVPGTHNVGLLRQTLQHLLDFAEPGALVIPRFDKAADDTRPVAEWKRITQPPEFILLEGWCLGAQPQPLDVLSAPLNDLERLEDPECVWRGYSNTVLQQEFQSLYPLVDQWVMLCAPSFECVFDWRREQERKLAATIAPELQGQLMNDEVLRRFIQHYERFTRHCLRELPQQVDHLFSLDQHRCITAYSRNSRGQVSQ